MALLVAVGGREHQTRRVTSQARIVLAKVAVATAGDLKEAGATNYEIRQLVTSGDVTQILHGVYTETALLRSLPEGSPKWHALLAAAYQRVSPGLIASHESAARVHGLTVLSGPGIPDHGLAFTRDAGRSRSARGTARVFAARLPREHVTTRFGVPVTTVARTVADIGRQATFMAGVVVADSALHVLGTSKRQVSAVLDICPRWPGVKQARRVVAFSNGLSESALESAARVVFAERGLPAPRVQAEIYAGLAFLARVDFMWHERWTVAEADGALKYDGRDKARAELRRDRRLRDAGYEVVHFTWQELFFETDLVEARIRGAFSRSAAIRR